MDHSAESRQYRNAQRKNRDQQSRAEIRREQNRAASRAANHGGPHGDGSNSATTRSVMSALTFVVHKDPRSDGGKSAVH